jgi:hypothetical protein
MDSPIFRFNAGRVSSRAQHGASARPRALTPVTGLLLRRAPLFHYSSRSPIMTFLLLSSQP